MENFDLCKILLMKSSEPEDNPKYFLNDDENIDVKIRKEKKKAKIILRKY